MLFAAVEESPLESQERIARAGDWAPAVIVKLSVKDHDGKPVTASFTFRDSMGRVYPAQTRRLAPDSGPGSIRPLRHFRETPS